MIGFIYTKIKILLIIMLLTPTFSCSTKEINCKTQKDKQNAFVVISPDYTLKNLELNPFYFYSLFHERVVCNLKLYDYCSDEELVFFSHTIFNSINSNKRTQFIINKYVNDKRLVINFLPDFKMPGQEKTPALFVSSNFDLKKNDFTSNIGESFTLLYYYVNSALIDRKYIIDPEKKVSESNTWKANDYLNDSNIDNNYKIEQLLKEDLANQKNSKKNWTYIILCQYYLSIGNIQDAVYSLDNAANINKDINEINFNIILKTTKRQIESTSRHYKM